MARSAAGAQASGGLGSRRLRLLLALGCLPRSLAGPVPTRPFYACSPAEMTESLTCFQDSKVSNLINLFSCCLPQKWAKYRMEVTGECFESSEDQTFCCSCFGRVLDLLEAHLDVAQPFLNSLTINRTQLQRSQHLVASPPPHRLSGDAAWLDLWRRVVVPWQVMSSQMLEDIENAVDPMSLVPATQTVYMLHRFLPTHVEYVYNRSGSDCVVNVWEFECSQGHAPVFRHFPPVQGPPDRGLWMDFLGVSTEKSLACGRVWGGAPNRKVHCLSNWTGLPVPRGWPILDEEYMEMNDILAAAFNAARRGRGFAMAEIGSGSYGIWAMRAAMAFVRRAEPWQTCDLLLVDDLPLNRRELDRHILNNLPPGRCKFHFSEGRIDSIQGLADVLARVPLEKKQWDLVDVDIQGSELEVFRGSPDPLQWKVHRLHVSTHSRHIHLELVSHFRLKGWRVHAERTFFSVSGLGRFGRFPTKDGHFTVCPLYGECEYNILD